MLLKSKSRYVAFGGISTALSIVFMLMASVIPFGRLVFVFFALAMIGIVIMAYNAKLAAIVYAAVSVLSLFFVPLKTLSVLYAVIGNYPLIKMQVNKLKNTAARILIKLVLFNAYMAICCVIGIKILGISMEISYPFWMLWIWMLLAFFVYDYAYDLFMQKIYYSIPKNKK